jgi:hypothetical protein
VEAELISSLISHTIVWPLGFGIVWAAIVQFQNISARFQVFIVTALILVVYTLLEGVPSFPPLAAKQKLSFLIALSAVALVVADRLQIKIWQFTIIVLGVGLAWLGWNKLMSATAWPQALLMLAPVAVAAFASPSLKTRTGEPFLWPATLLAFAIGGALLSLFGVFVGFAQAMGAMAAWLGGFMGFQFAVVAMGRRVNTLAPIAVHAVLINFASMSFMVALFAPSVSLWAYAVLSLTLLVPQFAPELRGLSPTTKPFAFGFLAAVPAVAAILIAFIQRGLSIG